MDVVTQEPTSSKICVEVSTQVQEKEIGAQEESVSTQELAPLNLVMEDDVTDEEEDLDDERIQELQREISLLKLELVKWKIHADQCKEGMVPLHEYRKTIKELREKWADELIFHKIQ